MKNQFSRTIGIVTMLVLFVMLTGGCLQKPDEEEKPTEMETSENGNTPQPQPTPEPEVTSGGLYTNKEYGFTLEYPKEWAGVRMVEELGTNPNDPLEKVLHFQAKRTESEDFVVEGSPVGELFYFAVFRNPQSLPLLEWLKAHEDRFNGGPEDPITLGYRKVKISSTVDGIQIYALSEITHPYGAGKYFANKDKVFIIHLLQDQSGWDNYREIVDSIIKSLRFPE